MFRKLSIYLLAATLVFTACKKSDPLTGPKDTSVAFVSFTNVNSSGKVVNVIVDGAKVNNVAPIAPFATVSGTYIGLQPGTRNIVIRDTTTAGGPFNYYNSNINVTGGNSYSFYIYDAVTAGALKGILLNTDRTADANGANAKLRFLNLSPASPALDFWMIRRETAVAKDSVMLYGAVPYLGNVPSPNITDLSAFKSVGANVLAGALSPTSPASDYILRVKLAGTGTIVASTAATTLVPTRNYTVFARGTYPAVTLTTMVHN